MDSAARHSTPFYLLDTRANIGGHSAACTPRLEAESRRKVPDAGSLEVWALSCCVTSSKTPSPLCASVASFVTEGPYR